MPKNARGRCRYLSPRFGLMVNLDLGKTQPEKCTKFSGGVRSALDSDTLDSGGVRGPRDLNAYRTTRLSEVPQSEASVRSAPD